MTTEKKPASRTRKPAKRGPTKAAALKALGLTQEDLDTIKLLTEGKIKTSEIKLSAGNPRAEDAFFQQPTDRGEASVKPAAARSDTLGIHPVDEYPAGLVKKTVAQQQAKIETYDILVAKDLPIPPDLKAEVEAMRGISQAPEQVFYARNLRNVDANIRLERHDKKKRFEFKPRGQRGDVIRILKEDLEDEALLANVGIIIEIITSAEAKEVIEKQINNVQTRVHPAMASLRNELGQPYEQGAVRVAEEFNSQGQVVAQLSSQGGGAGVLPSLGKLGFDWAAIHSGGQQASQVAPGGNPGIISDGFAAPPDVAADALARVKGLEGPAAGLGGAQFTGMAPVQRA